MHIKVLGTRGEIEESIQYHSKRSGVLIDNTLLLDCGEKSFLDYKPKSILITHLHPDHAYFVRYKEKVNFFGQIYAPEKFDNIDITETEPKKSFAIDSYKITPIPTIHSIKVKSNAYLINKNNKTILYTGDMIWIEKQYHKYLKNIDLVITEGSFLKNGGMIRRKADTDQIFGHQGVPDLIHFFKDYTKQILFVHFGSWFFNDIKKSRDKFKKLAKDNNVKIIVGYDGLEFEV